MTLADLPREVLSDVGEAFVDAILRRLGLAPPDVVQTFLRAVIQRLGANAVREALTEAEKVAIADATLDALERQKFGP